MRPTDLPYLYDICVLTAASGSDARSVFSDPFIPGQYYAAPYAACDNRCVLVLEGDVPGGTKPLGYILGTPDTQAYQQWFDRNWRPAAAALYCNIPKVGPNEPGQLGYSVDEKSIRALFTQPFDVLPQQLEAYPGHIHIDILPAAQGVGWGRALMDAFSVRLKSLGCPGFHLGVDKRNAAGIAFYRRYGMVLLQEPEWGLVFGKRL